MRRRLWPVLALGASLLGAPLGAQEPPRAGERPAQAPVTFWRIELAQVERRLQQIQEEALRDPDLAALDSLLGAQLAAAMAEQDPELHLAMEDAARLRRTLASVEAEGDTTGARAIGAAIREIDERFVRARAAALEHTDLADRVQVFNEALRLRMIEHDPEAARLFRQLEQLNAGLSRADASP